MLYPYLLYRSQGADMIAVQNSVHPHPKITAIIVPKDSPVQKFEDLKGKKISSWRAGCPYMVLFELAEKANWKQGADWEYINIPYTEHKDGLLSGEIDAISSHLLTDIIPMVTSGAFREVAYSVEDGVYVNGGGSTVQFVPTEFAKKYPKIIRAYLKLQQEMYDWILENKDEAAVLVKSVNRTPEEISKFAWDKERTASTWKSELDLEKVKRETKAMQDWLLAHGDIEQGKGVDVDTLYDPRFFESREVKENVQKRTQRDSVYDMPGRKFELYRREKRLASRRSGKDRSKTGTVANLTETALESALRLSGRRSVQGGRQHASALGEIERRECHIDRIGASQAKTGHFGARGFAGNAYRTVERA
jgi:ABC-type nitrate/sulfonate/bicarbonate transport system substrate-binding protein